MKRTIRNVKNWIVKGMLIPCVVVTVLASSLMPCFGEPASESNTEAVSNTESTPATDNESNTESTPVDENAMDSGTEVEKTEIKISNVNDFIEFAHNCQYDNWGLGKTVVLESDLDLASLDFGTIPYFSGTFDGAGHTISHVSLSEKSSDFGFFRYIGKNAVVKNLTISGTISPTGTKENIGGIVGVNYGTITNCSFQGAVSGENVAGGIAGINKSSGVISQCTSNAIVLAKDNTGGIAGVNEGLISGCKNQGAINTSELDTTMNMGGLDIGSFNLTQNVVTRNNMGGIAGNSSGTIIDCTNEGEIGFRHVGYNVGGIAGCQSGRVVNCENFAQVYGRKDVGGIVGQAEPYIESEYLDDKVAETRNEIKNLTNTLNNISSTLSSTSSQANAYVQSLSTQYQDSMSSVADDLGTLSDSIGDANPQAQGYVDNINNSLDSIQNEQEGTEGTLSQEQVDNIKDNLSSINDNLGNLQGTISDDISNNVTENGTILNTGTTDAAKDFATSVSDQLKNNDSKKDIEGLTSTIDQGIQSITQSIRSASNQIGKITDSIGSNFSVLTGEDEFIADISSINISEDTMGVISDCRNHGDIEGDLNTGGITGTMNIEYDADPEFDLDLTVSVNVTLRSTVNDVILHSINYGTITTKRSCGGGIAGLQELGILYDCEGYGTVTSDAGNYIGGIAGESASTITESYSLCNLKGVDYIGGICGSGYNVQKSISVVKIDSMGECLGGVAGTVSEEGTVSANQFVCSEVGGIDNINYAGTADFVSYEEIMSLENIPEGFSRVTVTFVADGDILGSKTVAYGGNLDENDLPEIPEKEGYCSSWPIEKELKNICQNLTVEAEYTVWTESIASTAKAEDGKPIFVIAGQFYPGTKIIEEKLETPELEGNVLYSYTWNLAAEEQSTFDDTMEMHFYTEGNVEDKEVWYHSDETKWKKADTVADGSYLVAQIPYGASVAVIQIPGSSWQYYMIGGAIAVVVCLLILVIRKRKKTANSQSKAGEKE